MNSWLSGAISVVVLSVATGLVLGSAMPSHADHELPKPRLCGPPLDEAERLALIEVPNGMASVPAGPFLMGSDPKVDRAAGPQSSRSIRCMSMPSASIDMRSATSIICGMSWPRGRRGRITGGDSRFPKRWPNIRSSACPGAKRMRIAGGAAPVSPRRRNGKRRQRGKTGVCSPGETSRLDGSRATSLTPGPSAGEIPPLANVDRYDNGVSPYGVYQLAGNVSEWVSDWFDPEYYRRRTTGTRWVRESGQDKVFRGGSWNEDPEVARSAGRNSGGLDHWSYLTGFRCAQSGTMVISSRRSIRNFYGRPIVEEMAWKYQRRPNMRKQRRGVSRASNAPVRRW